MTIKSRLQELALKWDTRDIREKANESSDAVGTLHLLISCSLKAVTWASSRFSTVTCSSMQDFADKTDFMFDASFPHIVGPPPTPVAKNAQAFYQWGVDNTCPPIGFYCAYPGLGVQDIRALLADRKLQRPPPEHAAPAMKSPKFGRPGRTTHARARP